MKLEQLNSDVRTLEHRAWSPWLEAAARLTGRFNDELSGDDPFSYNETASVSLLTAAAACAGSLALAEFTTTKKAAHNRRHKAHGRSDFWMVAEARSWAFEFKQISKGAVTAGRIATKMSEAVACARCVRELDANRAIAALIVPLFFLEEADAAKARVRLVDYAKSCKYAWRIHGRPGDASRGVEADPEGFLFFKIVLICA